MSFDYYKNLGRSLTVTSIIILSSLSAITYHGEAIGGARGGGAGSSQGKGAGNSIGMRPDLTKSENASDNARKHAAHNSAVILADPAHYEDDGTHIVNGN